MLVTGLWDIHPNGGDINNENTTFYTQANELWTANKTGELQGRY